MSGLPQAACQPFFLETAERRLFSLARRPAGAAATHGVLLCPPFAEEMNRCRRTASLLCAALARHGMLALSTDPGGTGDSSGEFHDARWDSWLDDLCAAADWLVGQGCSALTVVGVRAGALLAWALLRERGEQIANLVLWQPVLSGKAVVTDLLRARLAAAAAQGRAENMADLRAQLAAGTPVEAAGYLLSPGLAAALDAAAVTTTTARPPPDVCCIEIGSDAGMPLRAPVVKLADELRAAGARVHLARQEDPPFWSTSETTVGRGTVAATVQWLARGA